MKLGRPTQMEIKPSNSEKTEFRFLLTFPSSPRQVEFEIPASGAMGLMRALQSLQVRHKLPIPRPMVPSGKPKLRIVTDEPD
jgi:hypothetical protein